MALHDIPENILALLSPMQRIHMQHEEVIEKMALDGDAVPKGRGIALGLNRNERWSRMLYLGGLASNIALDRHVNSSPEQLCPDLFYLLKDHNGGKNPNAKDPADHWSKPGSTFVNRTVDCIGGMAWVGGWDRYQPVRFSHIYDGWINTDSMIMDATGPKKCFERVYTPRPGDYVVCASGSPGHKIGHIGGIIEIAENFDYSNHDHWKATKIVDCSFQGTNRCNLVRTMAGWFGTGAIFTSPKM